MSERSQEQPSEPKGPSANKPEKQDRSRGIDINAWIEQIGSEGPRVADSQPSASELSGGQGQETELAPAKGKRDNGDQGADCSSVDSDGTKATKSYVATASTASGEGSERSGS